MLCECCCHRRHRRRTLTLTNCSRMHALRAGSKIPLRDNNILGRARRASSSTKDCRYIVKRQTSSDDTCRQDKLAISFTFHKVVDQLEIKVVRVSSSSSSSSSSSYVDIDKLFENAYISRSRADHTSSIRSMHALRAGSKIPLRDNDILARSRETKTSSDDTCRQNKTKQICSLQEIDLKVSNVHEQMIKKSAKCQKKSLIPKGTAACTRCHRTGRRINS